MADFTDYRQVTIAAGTALSGVADLGGLQLVGIFTDTAWTSAAMTFSGSIGDITGDGVDDYAPVFNASGGEVTFAAAAIPTASRQFMSVNPQDFVGLRKLEVRSGTSAAPVNQVAARTITLVVRPV